MGADFVKFGAQNVSFVMLVAPNLAPWGPSSDAGGLGSTRKETLGFRAWTLSILGDSEAAISKFACLQVAFLKILESESGCLILGVQVQDSESCVKIWMSDPGSS